MGVCGSRPVSLEGSSAISDFNGVSSAGNGQPVKQVTAKLPVASGIDQQPLLATEAGTKDGSLTVTPVQDFTEQDSLPIEVRTSVPHQNGNGVGNTVQARLFKRGGQPQAPVHARPGLSGVDAAAFTGRSSGGAPQSNGPHSTITMPPKAVAAVAAAAAAAAATATAAAAAAAAVPNGAYAVAPNGLAAQGTGSVAAWRPHPPVIQQCEAVVQTDASLLYPLFRDPGPTVPVRWRKGDGIGSGSFGQVRLEQCASGLLVGRWVGG